MLVAYTVALRGSRGGTMALFVRSGGPEAVNIRCQTYVEAREKWDAMKVEHPNQDFTIIAEPERPAEPEPQRPVEPGKTPYGFKRARLSPRLHARSNGGYKSSSKSLPSGGASTERKRRKKQGGKG